MGSKDQWVLYVLLKPGNAKVNSLYTLKYTSKAI